jgi:hypothetical protein
MNVLGDFYSDLLFSRPDKEYTGWVQSDEGWMFGVDMIYEFVNKHNLKYIVAGSLVRTVNLTSPNIRRH